MAKCIRRVGIIFFALVISCLMIIGCVLAINTTNDNSNLGNNADNEIQPIATKYYDLIGSCANKYSVWQEAANYSVANGGVRVDLTLKSNWEAVLGGSHGSSFGSNNDIVITVPEGANMVLNLNGYNIDRKLTTAVDSLGYVIRVNGTFTLADYDINSPYNKDFFYIPVNGLNGYGQIRGGACYSYSGNIASAIYVSSSGTFDMAGGVICDNQLSIMSPNANTISGAVYCAQGATAKFEGGAIVSNSVNTSYDNARIAAISWNGANVTLKGGLVWDNDIAGVSGYGGTLTIGGGKLQVYNNNFADIRQDIVLMDGFSTSNIINCTGRIYEDSDIAIYDKRSVKTTAFTNGFSTANPNSNPNEFFYMSDSTLKERFLLDSNGEVKYGILTQISAPTRGSSSNYRKIFNDGYQTYYPIGYDANTMTITNNSGKYHGEYTAYVRLKNGYAWSGNTANVLSFKWYIDSKPIEKPTSGINSFEYNGLLQTYTPNGFDSKTMRIEDNTGTNAKAYSATVSLRSTDYTWVGGGKCVLSWKITPKPIEKPTPANSNEFIYNNAEQAYIPNGFDSTQMEITDNVKTAVGEYIAKVKPNSNHKWNDDTTMEIEFNFRILPPGIVVKDGMKYDYQYIDSNNSRQNYGNMYMHKLNDENLNVVNGIARHILGNIPISTTIDTFLNNLQSDRKLIKIYAKETDTTPIYDGLTGTRNEINRVLATGFKVELYNDANGQEKLDTIYLSVLGDINGDGRLTASDISYLRQVANNNALLESMPLENQLACMVNNRGGVTSVDCEIIRNVIANEIELEIFFESSIVEENNDYEYLTLNRDNLIRGTSEEQTNVIGNIAVNTSVATFKEKLAVLGIDTTAITIYDRKGNVVTDDNAIVGTGWRIVTGGKTIYLSVIGDLNGDGRITATDIANLREIAASDITGIQDCVLLSAILINKGGISNIDSEVLRVVIENKTNLNNY